MTRFHSTKKTRLRRYLLILILSLIPAVGIAQTNAASQAARTWRRQHEKAIVEEFIALLKIPNIAADHTNIQRNATAIVAMMEKRGIAARQVSVPGGNPVVFGEIQTPGATRTICFYAHYDGQPLDEREWTTPPFEPTLRDKRIEDGGRVISTLPASGGFDPESRLYARSAADDKAPIVALMIAVDAIRAAGIAFKNNIKFAFEGEEEAGSTNLEATLAVNKDLFAADLWLMCDGPIYQTRQQSVAFGARGVTRIDITVYGPRVELHSGHYGNWAPNPAMLLARLLTSMKDDNGRVLIEHFYDDVEPLGPVEKRAIAEAPVIDAALMDQLWLGTTDGRPQTLNELITIPSLNIRGMASSRVGAKASNVVPSSAVATIDIRMVKGMDPHKTVQQVLDHIRKQGFFVVDREPTKDERRSHPRVAKVVVGEMGVGSRTPMDLPISQEVIRAVESARGPAVKLPTMGGGLPLQEIERPLGTRTIIVPIGNHDNNQHSFDENLRLQNLWDGIELMAALLTM
jgi:acetylornithine deacetylase/succinyl-diaminopimelate desuccinylase-like protein